MKNSETNEEAEALQTRKHAESEEEESTIYHEG